MDRCGCALYARPKLVAPSSLPVDRRAFLLRNADGLRRKFVLRRGKICYTNSKMGDRRNIIAYILILAAIGVFAGGTGFRFYKERDERVPNTPPRARSDRAFPHLLQPEQLKASLSAISLRFSRARRSAFSFQLTEPPPAAQTDFILCILGKRRWKKKTSDLFFHFLQVGNRVHKHCLAVQYM